MKNFKIKNIGYIQFICGYSKVKVGEEEIGVGDCVTVEPNDPTIPVFIGRVMYMWQGKNNEKQFHAQWFW